jgi:uncharacterized membrane protein YoaK (UPF0700 family)
MRIDRNSIVIIAAMVIGIVYVTLCYKLPGLQHLELLQHVLLALVALGPIILIFVSLAERNSLPIAVAVFGGIAVGVIIDAFSDTVDRNLFPIEILSWWALLAPAVITGTTLGWWIRKYRRNKSAE